MDALMMDNKKSERLEQQERTEDEFLSLAKSGGFKAKARPDARLSAYEIASHLSIPNQDAPNMLHRMLRLLASHSIVTCTQGEHGLSLVRVLYSEQRCGVFRCVHGIVSRRCLHANLETSKTVHQSKLNLPTIVAKSLELDPGDSLLAPFTPSKLRKIEKEPAEEDTCGPYRDETYNHFHFFNLCYI
ncbi:caffeic acid 3-O-methyltransferase-like protein [Tanacetum coccineum]